MQSTALALMSCENALAKSKGKAPLYPLVPIYDVVIFCDLGLEPIWVKEQAEFVREACESVGIKYKELSSPLFEDFTNNFGKKRVVSIPWWTLDENGHKSKFPRFCTIDYKVEVISKYVKWELLGYKKGQRLREEDKKAHELHMGFSYEEGKRCKESPNPMFVNKFPLVEMQMERKDNYAYILEVWGLDTKASACAFCPFHRNYFFEYLKENDPITYQKTLMLDKLLEDNTPCPPTESKLYISRSRKRLSELAAEDCNDAERFPYKGKMIWNGF
ncbi:MAG: hypothetical protein K2G60_04140 [Oscillospiraceae bacterium]|nr:hypothetical protein [Oscillospiraceae bacterium]